MKYNNFSHKLAAATEHKNNVCYAQTYMNKLQPLHYD